MNFPGYVINLDSEYSRWESSKGEASAINLNLIRVSAVNSADLVQSPFVTNGVQAAWKSHMKALELFLSSDSEYAFILEDDFGISNPEWVLNFMESSEYLNWDFIQFGFLTPGIDTKLEMMVSNFEATFFRILSKFERLFKKIDSNFSDRLRIVVARNRPVRFVADDCLPGAHFYLVNRRIAAMILELNEPQFLSIDDFYAALSRMRTFRMLRGRKTAVIQKPFPAWQGSRFIRD